MAMVCLEKSDLLSKCQQAAQEYTDSLSDLKQKMGILPRSEFERLRGLTEEARENLEALMRGVERHIGKHGC